jgi:hypothetical protein
MSTEKTVCNLDQQLIGLFLIWIQDRATVLFFYSSFALNLAMLTVKHLLIGGQINYATTI